MLYNSGLWTLVRIVEVSVIGESVFGGSTVLLAMDKYIPSRLPALIACRRRVG